MGIGSLLMGLALAIIAGAWLMRPFRPRQVAPDRAIEAWVAQVRAGRPAGGPGGTAEEGPEGAEVNFCPRCGRRVGPEDRFCARCGAPLRGGAS